MTTLEPGGGPGSPVAWPDPDHQPRVPTEAGIPPYCTCGYVGGNGTDHPLLADHLRTVNGLPPLPEVRWPT